MPGIVIGVILFITVRQPSKKKEDTKPIVEDTDQIVDDFDDIITNNNNKSTLALSFNGKLGMRMEPKYNYTPSFTEKIRLGLRNVQQILKEFFKPTLLLLCLASSIRNAGLKP
jgi:hypothetical protein